MQGLVIVAVGCNIGFTRKKIRIVEHINLAHDGHVGCVRCIDGVTVKTFMRQPRGVVGAILIDGLWRIDGCFR